jgi:hypothetical protein
MKSKNNHRKSDSFMSVGINMVLLRRRNFIWEVPFGSSQSVSLVVKGEAPTWLCQDKTSHHRICEEGSDAVDKRDRSNASFIVLFWGIGGGVSATHNSLR